MFGVYKTKVFKITSDVKRVLNINSLYRPSLKPPEIFYGQLERVYC